VAESNGCSSNICSGTWAARGTRLTAVGRSGPRRTVTASPVGDPMAAWRRRACRLVGATTAGLGSRF
jgi:hypothetical protein